MEYVFGEYMTYRYSKQRGWVGFCDECKYPFKPHHVCVITLDISSVIDMVDIKTFNYYSHGEFFGVCCKFLKPIVNNKFYSFFCVVVDDVIVY